MKDEMKKKIYIVGIGMGNPDTLTLRAKEIIEGSQAVVGAKRMVDSFPFIKGQKHCAILAEDIFNWICQSEADTIAVLMSGDVGFFSGAKKLMKLMRTSGYRKEGQAADAVEFELELIPGISSLSYFCAKLGRSWESAKIVSLHGRAGDPASTVQTNESTFFLTGGDHPVQEICARLTEVGLGSVEVFVGENLSYEEERIVSGSAQELAGQSFDPLSVMLVENDKPIQSRLASHGFSDEEFLRGDVPMTKEEVRSVTLSKLRLQRDDIVYDVGAGTGSVSVEMALAACSGQVYAIETNKEALTLIEQNRHSFGAWNLQVVGGQAPQAMEELPPPDKAFIGGTKGSMEDIVAQLVKKNPQVRVVINAIALETVTEAMKCLAKYNFQEVEVVQLSVARSKEVGSYHMMMGQNPVFIISGQAGF